MRIDWDGMLQPKPEAVGQGGAPAHDERMGCSLHNFVNGHTTTAICPPVAVIDADIAAREREGDDRRRCGECGNLGERGVCLAAQRREIVAARGYTPMRDILRRCEGFAPLPNDPDQRHGRAKWACLFSRSAGNGAPP